MFTFLTLKDLYDYIPNCIICGKGMNLSLSGQHSKMSHIGPGYNYKTGFSNNTIYSAKTSVHLKASIKDNLVVFKNRKLSFKIDLDTNRIFEGGDLVNNLATNWIFLNKSCTTCDFKIRTLYNSGNEKTLEIFPPLKRVEEKLNYTMKRGQIIIQKHFYDDATLLGETTQITINRKPVTESVHLDFSKFKDIKQLNRRLETIMMFQ